MDDLFRKKTEIVWFAPVKQKKDCNNFMKAIDKMVYS